MENAVGRGPDWAGLPVIATVARLLCRELTLQNEYLRLENRTLKEKVPGRIRFTDEERRSLAEAALAMGRSLMKEVVSIVKPETILAWQRRLERRKWDYSAGRRRGPGRPRTPDDIEALVCRLARENLWGYQRLRGELLKLRVILSKGCIADILWLLSANETGLGGWREANAGPAVAQTPDGAPTPVSAKHMWDPGISVSLPIRPSLHRPEPERLFWAVPSPLNKHNDTQMTLFAAEGLIRARQRYRDRGICNPTMVVWHAYLRWLGTQGIERFDLEFPAQHGGWLYEQPELHSRRAPGNTCLSAVASGECGTIAAAPISRTLKIISTCEMGTPKPFSTAAASRKDSPSPHSTTDITLGRSECLQPGCKPGGVTVTLAPQLSHWY